MTHKPLVRGIAVVEMLVGAVTMAGLAWATVALAQSKPLNVLFFVLVTAGSSFVIGVGLWRREEWARILLVFFSGYIILTKALIFAGLLHFEGELFTVVSADLKNAVSIAYHGFVMIYFERAAVRKEFAR